MDLAVVSTGHHYQGRSAVKHYEAAEKIGDLAEVFLDDPEQGMGIDLPELIEMVDTLENANRNIRSALGKLRATANWKIEATGEQRVVLGNGIVAERTGSWRRTNVDRDALVKYVAKCARLDDIRMDPETGELRPPEVVALELHLRCFRPEPKWTELKALGVDDDEFCHREFQASIKINKAKVL